MSNVTTEALLNKLDGLRVDTAANLTTKGVPSEATETLDVLVPKILTIPSGGEPEPAETVQQINNNMNICTFRFKNNEYTPYFDGNWDYWDAIIEHPERVAFIVLCPYRGSTQQTWSYFGTTVDKSTSGNNPAYLDGVNMTSNVPPGTNLYPDNAPYMRLTGCGSNVMEGQVAFRAFQQGVGNSGIKTYEDDMAYDNNNLMYIRFNPNYQEDTPSISIGTFTSNYSINASAFCSMIVGLLNE